MDDKAKLLRALEAFIDAKVAFAKMTPEQRLPLIPALDTTRAALLDTLAAS